MSTGVSVRGVKGAHTEPKNKHGSCVVKPNDDGMRTKAVTQPEETVTYELISRSFKPIWENGNCPFSAPVARLQQGITVDFFLGHVDWIGYSSGTIGRFR